MCTVNEYSVMCDYSAKKEKLAALKAAKGDRPKKVHTSITPVTAHAHVCILQTCSGITITNTIVESVDSISRDERDSP